MNKLLARFQILIRLALPLLVALNLALTCYLFYAFVWEASQSTPPHQQTAQSHQNQLIDYTIPDSLSFAGERVPLENPMIYERLDNALAHLVYRHARTSQNLKRAHRWFPEIEAIFKAKQIPDDFKYLAVIESNLQNLISYKGATGFWQLMPATARNYGLEIREEVDERYHPIKSTRAAVQYFQEAYQIFENWTLVAASYNMGMAGLKKRLKQQQADSYYDLYLNAETSAYVFYALATKCIFEHPEKYGYDLQIPEIYRAPNFQKIKVEQSIPDLIQFAQQENISYATLKYHNPWLRSTALTIQKPTQYYEILVPK